MSSIKREWTPCKICEKYYNEECDKKVAESCEFQVCNDFRQFLACNELVLNKAIPLGTILFADEAVEIDILNKKVFDLRNMSSEELVSHLHYVIRNFNFSNMITNITHNRSDYYFYILPIDEATRNTIYDDPMIMENFIVKICVSNDVKKNLNYILDERFKKIILTD